MSHIVCILCKYVTTNKKYPQFNCLNRAKKKSCFRPDILGPTQKILKSYGIFKSISILFKGFLYFLPYFFSHFEVLWNIYVNFYTFQKIFILLPLSFLVILKSYGILKSISKLFKGFLYSYHIFLIYTDGL